MLVRRIASVGGALVLAAISTAVPARAAAPVCEKFNQRGVCVIWAGGGATPGSGPDGGSPSGATAGETSGASTGTHGSTGATSNVVRVNGVTCLFMGALAVAPLKTDPIWGGHSDGGIYQCLVAGSDVNGDRVLLFWAAGPPPAAPPPDPRVLARQAVTAMQLKAVNIGIVPEPRPGSIGIIGLPTWMWVEGAAENTWGPITRTASAGGFTVRATARVKKVVWDMGDGTQVVCFTKGTPYADFYGRQSSPGCGHTYTRQGSYAVTATSYWSVTWAGVGESGVIPLDLSRTTNITMGESQVINR